MLTRKKLSTADPLTLFGEDKSERYFNAEERHASLTRTLLSKPDDSPVWIFAYGSLMWNPVIDYVEKCKGKLPGWERAFCMKLNSGRATPEKQGRMLALVPGKFTEGLLYRLDQEGLYETLTMLWLREMSTASYQVTWQKVILEDDNHVWALVFVMSSRHRTYEHHYQPEDIARFIATASGPIGTNADYLFRLKECLASLDIEDPYVESMANSVSQISVRGE